MHYHERKGSSVKPAPRILVAEDDEAMRDLTAQVLRRAGYSVVTCNHGWDLLGHLGYYLQPEEYVDENYDLVITDNRMPGITGMSILKGLHDIAPCPPMILTTAFGDEEMHAEARLFGAAETFDKPFNLDDLVTRVMEIVPLTDI